MSTNECAQWLQDTGARTESRLAELLQRPSVSPQLRAAMQYAALDGGKRLRPAMTFAAAKDAAAALDVACALECVHCYSLAHDDLPCMDAAATRRGKPACHIEHGEALALLAGDCLHSLAFEILADCELPPAATRLLARAAGADGMGGGQALDLRAAAEDEPALRQMHELKTGALFDCALQLGLLCRPDETDAEESRRLRVFAAAFGRLFQIANDIKDAAADAALGKTTYCTVLGAAPAKEKAREARDEAQDALGGEYPHLSGLAEIAWGGVQ